MRYEHSKSSTFLLEVLINILLFSILCVCSLQFFIKSKQLTENTTTLHHAVTCCNNVAAVYQSENGSLDRIEDVFPYAFTDNGLLYIYFDENFKECDSQHVAYYIVITQQHTEIPSIHISFYENGNDVTYSVEVYKYQPLTPSIINVAGGVSNE